MHTKVLLITGLVCLTLLIVHRRRDFFASSDLSNAIPYTDSFTGGLSTISTLGFLLNELSKNTVYPSANALVSAMGTTFSMYSSDAQIEELFRKAYTDGETGLPERDRLLLREIAYFSSASLENITIGNVNPTYTADGVPDFTNTMISESGKSVREFLFSVLSNDYNNILPRGYSRIADTSTYDVKTDTDQQRMMWIVRATVIPHSYIKWLSENKWKLDMSWKPTECPASVTRTPTRITTVPGNLSFGPGTYTMAQLGNPTNINLYAPIKVVVNKNAGSSTHKIERSIGCRGIDKTIDNLTNVTSIVVTEF
jgi:hypothetical protein